MRIFKEKNIRGITLVETIIYVLLFGIIMSSLVSFGLLLSALNNKNLIMREANANSRNVLIFLNTQIEYSKNIISPSPGMSSGTLLYLDQDDVQKEIKLENGSLYLLSDNNSFKFTRDNIFFSNLLFHNLSSLGNEDNIQFSFNYSSRASGTREFYYENSLRSDATRRF